MKTNLPPHLNPLPQGGEEIRFDVRPLPRGEGRGEGQIAKHFHTAAAFLVITLLLAAGNAACAQPFNNWPTYASDPLTNWPKASEYEKLVEDLTWCHDALEERSVVVGQATTGIAPAVNSVRQPKVDVERMKNQIELLIPQYVDHGQAGSFTNLSEFPMLVETGVMADLSLPVDFLDRTPYSRCLDDVLAPTATTNYGVPGVKESICELKWTKRHFLYADRGNSATNHYTWMGSTEPWYYSTYGAAEAVISNAYNSAFWQDSSGGHDYYYYELNRGMYYWSGIGTGGWKGSAVRTKSTPQCPDITVPDNVQFSWEAYLEPEIFHNDCGASYDGYSGWAEDRLNLWDTGGPTASNVVRADTLGGVDETFPFTLAPALVQAGSISTNNVAINVRQFHWLLKWDFQHDD